MQITFDPTDKREADYVRRMLGGNPEITMEVGPPNVVISDDFRQRAEAYAKSLREQEARVPMMPPEDNPETGAPAAPSAAPLPPEVPAPSIAAADVFPIAPVVPQASIPQPPPVPVPPAPTAPPPAAVPAAPAAPTNHANAVQLDKRGIPHDVRIHSKEPTLTESGVWRKRRGLNDESYVKRIEEELLQLMAIPTLGAPAPSAAPLPPAAVVAPPPVASAPVSAPSAPPVPIPPAPVAATVSVPPPPVTPATPPVVPAPPVLGGVPSTVPTAPPAMVPGSIAVPDTFAKLMRLITDNIRDRKLTEAEVHAELHAVDLGQNDIGKLSTRMKENDIGDRVARSLTNLLNSRGG